jgi:hypothetical protein
MAECAEVLAANPASLRSGPGSQPLSELLEDPPTFGQSRALSLGAYARKRDAMRDFVGPLPFRCHREGSGGPRSPLVATGQQ